MRIPRSKAAVLTLAATLALATGCTRRADGAVSGERVDACTGIRLYNSLKAPPPDDGKAIERYASNVVKVLGNVNPRFSYKDSAGRSKDVPTHVLDDVEALEARTKAFRAEVAKANAIDDKASRQQRLGEAASKLAADAAYVETDRRLQEFVTGDCG